MSPQEKTAFDRLSKLVAQIVSVRHVPFIQELKRRVVTGVLKAGPVGSPSSISQSVRNSTDTGSIVVAKEFDGKVALYDNSGTLIGYVGIYNS